MSKLFAIWLTGIPSSGKSTLAKGLRDRLVKLGYKVEILESDQVRRIITPKPRYDDYERDLFYRALVAIGKYLVENDIIVLFDATAHKKAYREYGKKVIRRLIEVYVYCPLEVCIKRDVKGLYTKAFKGEIKTLPGLQVPYEEPENPDIIVYTHRESIEESVNKIMEYIESKYLRYHGIL